MNITSIILAGGRSSRLGKEKHVELVAGKTLIERTTDLLGLLSAEILIVISNQQSKSSFSSYSKAHTVVDLKPGKGSLGGIYTGLSYANNFHSIVVACDMPFLNAGLLNHMIDMAASPARILRSDLASAGSFFLRAHCHPMCWNRNGPAVLGTDDSSLCLIPKNVSGVKSIK